MRRRHTIRRLIVAASVICAALPFAAQAQQTQTQSGSTEVPARLSHLEGTVTVQRAAAGETEDAVINLPLGSGDRIWTDDDGRVEITFEDGTSLWLDTGTTLDFVSLPRPDGDQGVLVRLWNGSAFVHRPAPYGSALVSFRVDAPSGSALFDQEGVFRLDVDEEQTVWLSAYDGSAVLDAGGLSERVSAGQRTLAESGSAPARAVAFNTSESDDFTIWRDQRTAQYASTQEYTRQREYLPSNVAHYATDLEPYGEWSYHPTYASWYWKPYAAVAWTPYRHGRWIYTYAGWTWVPATRWGYVTTHYGRWHHGSSGWIWFPGRVWRPASVHWYVGGGYVGWVPLNYYGRPAVSFGAYLGGGVSVNVGIGGGYHYPYYGYGHSYWGYRPYYRCCNYYGGKRFHRNRFDFGRFPTYHASNRRGGDDRISPIGSASGGRVIKGRGYSSGRGDAWTMVPADDFSTAEVGRRAVRRNALPRGIGQASNAELSGNLRARQPGNLVPNTTGRRAVPRGSLANPAAVNGTPGPVRATTRGATSRGDARPRAAVPRQSAGSPAATNGPARRANGAAPTTGRAVRRGEDPPAATTPQRATTAPRAVRRNNVTTPQRTPTTPRAVPRNGATTPPRTPTAPRAMRRNGATTPQRTPTAPRAVRRTGEQPSATTPRRTPTVRRAVPDRGMQPASGSPPRSDAAPRAVRRTNARPSATTTPPRTPTAPRAVPRTNRRPSATGPARAASSRSRNAVAPRSSAQRGRGAVRARTPTPTTRSTPAAGGARRTAPRAGRSAPRAGARPSSGAARRPTRAGDSSGSVRSAPRSRVRATPSSTRRVSPRASSRRPPSRTVIPRSRSNRPTVTPRSAPRRSTRTPTRRGGSSGSVRSAPRRSSGARRPAPTVRSSRSPSSAASRGAVRRAVPSGRTAPAVRPAPSRSSRAGRPAAGSSRARVGRSASPRRSGGGAAGARRTAKPRGGSRGKPGGK